jgi:hypothetical protein
MNFQTHNETDIPTAGTYFQGQITETFEKLLEVFGTPLGASADNKVDVEWAVETDDGTIATIYNYKDGNAYCGEDGLDPVDIVNWHVGGKSKSAAWEIEEILKSN